MTTFILYSMKSTLLIVTMSISLREATHTHNYEILFVPATDHRELFENCKISTERVMLILCCYQC